MKLLISLVCLFSVNLSCQDCKALLTIETNNDLAFVIINDSLEADGRITEFELDPGTYIIVVGENSDRWDAETFYDTIIVTACEKINRSYKFGRQTMLDSSPQDAYVYSNDTLIGHTPLLLSPEINSVTLKKDGYKEISHRLSGADHYEKVELIYTGREKKESFFESSAFKYLTGTLLVFGGITAYYKIQADKKFTDYQFTGSEELLKETRRFDTISGISFAAVQINFGLLLYFLLSD
jgi:hypothetical protein